MDRVVLSAQMPSLSSVRRLPCEKRERAGIASCGEAVAGVGEGDVVAAVLSARASARPTGPAPTISRS